MAMPRSRQKASVSRIQGFIVITVRNQALSSMNALLYTGVYLDNLSESMS